MLFAAFCLLSLLSLPPLSASSPIVEEQIINLDLPPKERYRAFINQYKAKVQKVLAYIQSIVPSVALDFFTTILGDFDRFIDQPYADEMRGLAEESGFTLGDVMLLNTFYELTAACTSIVALNTQNNSAVHGRNLDFDIPHLGPITVQVKVIRNGTFLYKATTFAGMIGILTGMKPGRNAGGAARKGGWTFSLDQRDEDGPLGTWINALEAMFRGGRVTSLLIREMMDATGTDQEYDFDSASTLLQNVHLIAPSYLIIGNASGGAVITRDRDSAIDFWPLDPHTMRPPAIVETNYDHWNAPPPDDDRRDPAYKNLAALGSANFGPATIESKVMSAYPNLNDGTVYTTVMELATLTYYSIRRQFE